MAKATFSSKGQIVIPKELRDEKGIVAGVVADAVIHPDGILLKLVQEPKKKYNISQLVGKYNKYKRDKPVTIEEMNEAVILAAVERYERSKL